MERAGTPFQKLKEPFSENGSCGFFGTRLNPRHHTHFYTRMASWRSGDAEDCKSLYPGSIPGEASIRTSPYRDLIYQPAFSP